MRSLLTVLRVMLLMLLHVLPVQILRLFSESAESISLLKVDMAEAKKRLSSRNKQLRQMWYRSLTLRHILSLLDQIEGVAKVRRIFQLFLSCMNDIF